MGRYRIWGWAGVYWCVLCAAQATGLHAPAGELLQQRWPLACWRPETLYWLVPATVAYLAIFQLLGREMRHCRVSKSLWWTSFLWGGAGLALWLGLKDLLPEPWRTPATVATLTGWQLLLAITFLVHARFVVHVSKEAGPQVTPWSNRTWNWLVTRFERRKSQQTAPPTTSRSKRASKTNTEAPVSEKPTRRKAAVTTPEKADADTPAEATGFWRKRFGKRVLGKTLRVDAPASGPAGPHQTIVAPVEDIAPQKAATKPVDKPKPAPVAQRPVEKPAVAAKTPASVAVEPPVREPAVAPKPAARPRVETWDEEDEDEDDRPTGGRGMSKQDRKRLKKEQRRNRDE